MLYDNALLLALYAQAAAATGEALFIATVEGTAAWLLRELRDAGGALYSSLDADSEGHEGRFYVWQREAVQQALTPQEFAVCAPHFGLDRPANFEAAGICACTPVSMRSPWRSSCRSMPCANWLPARRAS